MKKKTLFPSLNHQNELLLSFLYLNCLPKSKNECVRAGQENSVFLDAGCLKLPNGLISFDHLLINPKHIFDDSSLLIFEPMVPSFYLGFASSDPLEVDTAREGYLFENSCEPKILLIAQYQV